VRLYGDGVLSFGAKGMYMGQRLHRIPQVQGALMVREGYAVDNVTHCVMSNDIKVMGADFILHFVVE